MKATADLPTDPSTNPSTDPSTDPPAGPPADLSTDPSTDPPANTLADPSTDLSTDSPANSSTVPRADQPTDSPTDSPANPPTDSLADPPTNPPANPPIDPLTDPPAYSYLNTSRERHLPPDGIKEVDKRSGRTSLAPWTTDGLSFTQAPGGRKGYTYPTDPIDNPPPYSHHPKQQGDDGDDRKGEKRGDGSLHREYRIGDKRPHDHEQSDDEDRGRKRTKTEKTPIACDFCRKRKLKCGGGRPSCDQCNRKREVCIYKDAQRRRGPGRKNKGLPTRPRGRQRERDAQSEASTSMSTPNASSSFTYRHEPFPTYLSQAPLPGPPIPQYNYNLGQIRSSSIGLRTGTLSRSESSGIHEPRRFDSGQLYPQPEYTGSPELRDHARQPRQEQYHHRPAAHEYQQPAHLYRNEYSQAPNSLIGNFHGGPSAESQRLQHSQVGDNEGISPPRLKRRQASSPPEDIGPSNPKQKRYYDPDEDGR